MTWGGQASGVLQVTVEEAATEALETDNLALQTMSGGKYVQVGSPKCRCFFVLCILSCNTFRLPESRAVL